MIEVGEPIHVPRETNRWAPVEFFWRGNRHLIRSWEARPPASRDKGRRFYRVRTATGLRCMVSEDPGRGQWRLEKVLAPSGRAL